MSMAQGTKRNACCKIYRACYLAKTNGQSKRRPNAQQRIQNKLVAIGYRLLAYCTSSTSRFLLRGTLIRALKVR